MQVGFQKATLVRVLLADTGDVVTMSGVHFVAADLRREIGLQSRSLPSEPCIERLQDGFASLIERLNPSSLSDGAMGCFRLYDFVPPCSALRLSPRRFREDNGLQTAL